MSEPKGTKEVIAFLKAKKAITLAKEELPSSAVHREAILHVAIMLQEKLEALEAKLGESTSGTLASTSSLPVAATSLVATELNAATPIFVPAAQNTAGATSPETAVGAPLMAAGVTTPSNAAGAKNPSTTPMAIQAIQRSLKVPNYAQ